MAKNLIAVWRVQTALNGRSVCHGYQHAIEVDRIATSICKKEGGDADIVTAIAFLHDVWDHKFVNDSENIRRKFKSDLVKDGYTESEIEVIYEAVDNLSWSKGDIPTSLEGKIVQDADRITAIGAIGIMRATTFGSNTDRPFYETVDHLIVKCLHIKHKMNTKAGKAIAEQRHDFLVSFIKQFEDEMSLE
jgi:uncharacterized protein